MPPQTSDAVPDRDASTKSAPSRQTMIALGRVLEGRVQASRARTGSRITWYIGFDRTKQKDFDWLLGNGYVTLSSRPSTMLLRTVSATAAGVALFSGTGA